MSTSVDIPGGTAWLRDPADIRERHRRLVQTAMVPLRRVFAAVPQELAEIASGTGPEAEQARIKAGTIVGENVTTRQEAAAMKELHDAVIVALLSEWSLPERVPTMDTIEDVSPEIYDALDEHTWGRAEDVIAASLPTNFGPQDEKAGDTPFVKSSGSATTSSRRARARGPASRSARK